MFCLRYKFHINEMLRILQTKLHGSGVLQFHDRYIGGPTITVLKKSQQSARGGPFYIVALCLSVNLLIPIRKTGGYTSKQ